MYNLELETCPLPFMPQQLFLMTRRGKWVWPAPHGSVPHSCLVPIAWLLRRPPYLCALPLNSSPLLLIPHLIFCPFSPCCIATFSPFHTLMNFSLIKSLSALPLSILYVTSKPLFYICSSFHWSFTIHFLPLRMNANKKANVDEMMPRICFLSK